MKNLVIFLGLYTPLTGGNGGYILRAALDLLNQIFIFIIHHCFERNYLCSRVLSIVLVYRKIILRLFKLYFFFFFWSFTRSRNFEQFYWILSLLLGSEVIMYSIDSSNSFRFTKFFKNIIYWTLFFYQSDINQKYYVCWRIF